MKELQNAQKQLKNESETKIEELKGSLEQKQNESETKIEELKVSLEQKQIEFKQLKQSEVSKGQEISALKVQMNDLVIQVDEMRKLTAPSSCEELQKQGISRSQQTYLDGDGQSHGAFPAKANCIFPEAKTVFGEEKVINITACGENPMCFIKVF